MSILLGADLNGVSDHRISRDLEGKEDAANIGIHSSLVRLAADGTWVGGAQAASAPHGRGDAWGAIGAKANRIFLSDFYEDLVRSEPGEARADAVEMALPGILLDCELAHFAIPDAPSSDDVFRERYLSLLRRVRGVRRPMLLWRSIAAYLGWVRSEPATHRTGQRIGVLSLMLDGLHFSELRTEAHGQGEDRRLVPVRRQFGRILGGAFRGKNYVEELEARLASKSGLSNQDLIAVQTPWRIATGHRTEGEIVKRAGDNRWIRLPEISVTATAPTSGDVPPGLAKKLGKIDILLIEGPFSGQSAWVNGIKEALGPHLSESCHVVHLDRVSVAQGCLEAGDRLKKGHPVYFDFLPQLQINAMVEGKPQFVDLIESDTRCPGGRPYKASAKGRYAIGIGAERLRFWLFKEDFDRGRKIEKPLGVASDKQYPLSISVEQSPGQGLARVQISSPEYEELRRNPIVLDWMQMEEIAQSQAEIIAQLDEDADLSYPDASIAKGHPFLWLPNHPYGSLCELLQRFTAAPLVKGNKLVLATRDTLQTLSLRFSRPEPPAFLARGLRLQVDEKGAFHPLNGDGSLPEEASGLTVPPESAEVLAAALAKFSDDVDDLEHSFGSEIDPKVVNDVVGFGSWCFRRCPDNLIAIMLRKYEGASGYRIHPTRLREGLGRVVSESDDLRRYFEAVMRRLEDKKTLTMHEYSALGRVLGGVESAARTIETDAARRLMQEVIRELLGANTVGITKAYKMKFKAILKLAAALLRHREEKRDFVDPHRATGQKLLAALGDAERRNREFAAQHEEVAFRSEGGVRAKRLTQARRLRENAEIVAKIAPFVQMQGKYRDIIDQIDAMDDDDDDDGDGDANNG